MKLYRATNNKSDAKKVPAGSCWSPELSTAEAYTDNPGFGGRHIVSIEIDPTKQAVADWTDAAGGTRAMICDLVGETEEAEDMIGTWAGYEVFQAIENNATLRRLAAEQYDWVSYTDDYPVGATTYRKM